MLIRYKYLTYVHKESERNVNELTETRTKLASNIEKVKIELAEKIKLKEEKSK
ncbi:MAG: hypothetical protein H6613_01895 [Ignavibacteriales bacterium]|nr:hypothetical protein [Ignavibacteriales bacterium]